MYKTQCANRRAKLFLQNRLKDRPFSGAHLLRLSFNPLPVLAASNALEAHSLASGGLHCEVWSGASPIMGLPCELGNETETAVAKFSSCSLL